MSGKVPCAVSGVRGRLQRAMRRCLGIVVCWAVALSSVGADSMTYSSGGGQTDIIGGNLFDAGFAAISAKPDVDEYLRRRRKEALEKKLQDYRESKARRISNLFFISFPFSGLMIFFTMQIYGMAVSGNNRFQLNRTHIASLVVGSSIISGSVAYKGYLEYERKRDQLLRQREKIGAAQDRYFGAQNPTRHGFTVNEYWWTLAACSF